MFFRGSPFTPGTASAALTISRRRTCYFFQQRRACDEAAAGGRRGPEGFGFDGALLPDVGSWLVAGSVLLAMAIPVSALMVPSLAPLSAGLALVVIGGVRGVKR